MKKFMIAAGISLLASTAFAQSPSPDNSNYNATTEPNGVASSTTAGQGTGAGADMSKKMPAQGTDDMSTGSMTPDTGMAPKRKTGAGLTSGGNSNATTDVNGVSSSTSAGQGTGAGADVAK